MEKSTTIQLNAALSFFEDNLEDIKQALADNILDDLSRLQPWGIKGELVDEIIKLEKKLIIEPRQRTIKRIVAYQQHKQTPKKEKITDQMIEQAREFPIKELWEELVGPLKFKMGECPFHSERTSSVSVGKHNRYHCFGCDAKGDTIDLYMKMNKVNFIQAVKALQ